jgi:predicted solute-binding protein
MAQNLKITPTVPLQLGWIPYWNLLPLRHELERACGKELQLHKGTPSVVNKWLTEGKVALAPCSSVCLLKNKGHEMALPLGIAANGPVTSVYLGIHQDDAGLLERIRARQHQLREIAKVGQARYGSDARQWANFVWKAAALEAPASADLPPPLVVTPASATSTNLARILYRLWFGQDAYEMRATESGGIAASTTCAMRKPIELLIGDEALQRRPQFKTIIDLGEAWRELTDLPFVFAVWQSNGKAMSPYWRQKITEAAEIAQARMRVESCTYMPDMMPVDVQNHPIDLAAYWRVIQYRLTAQHFKGLAAFLALSRCLTPMQRDDEAVCTITRWERFADEVAAGAR